VENSQHNYTAISTYREVLITKIEDAKANYRALEIKGIILDDESVNYHLPLWQTILKTPSLGVTLKK